MLLICPVRPGDNNPELRYAIRSWETNLLPDEGLELWTVGYQPSWLKPDRHIGGNFHKSSARAVFDNVRLGAEEAYNAYEPEVVYMNDDFFCLDPMASVLPVRRNQSMAEHLTLMPAGSGLWWPTSLRLTASWLTEQGFPDPDSYEVHRPLLANPAGMLEAQYRWLDGTKGTPQHSIVQWRTIYGVLNKVDAVPVQDCKLGVHNSGIGSPWISTSDHSWRRYASSIRERFQKPSRWER